MLNSPASITGRLPSRMSKQIGEIAKELATGVEEGR